jgi:formylglycine-generating enzyme
MKTRNKLLVPYILCVLIATLVAGGMSYAATDLGGAAANAVDGKIAVGNTPVPNGSVGVAWDLSQATPQLVTLPLDPIKYDTSDARAVSGNIVVGTAWLTTSITQDAVAWDVSTFNAPQSIDLVSAIPAMGYDFFLSAMSVGLAVSGNVVVGTVFDNLGWQHAVAWDVTDRKHPVAKDLGSLGGTYAWPYAVSGTMVVGESEITRTVEGENAPVHAFAYDLAAPSPHMVDLDPTGTYELWSSAYALSGSIAVGYGTTAAGVQHALAWDLSTPTPTLIDLGTMQGGTYSEARAVGGNIVVGSADDASGNMHAFAYDLGAAAPQMVDLGTLQGGTYSAAGAVSGNIVVGSADDASGNMHAFAYDLGAVAPQMIDLGTLGGLNSNAWAVSGNVIVGQAENASSEMHAALWLHAITIDTVVVGNAGNAADNTGYGAVGYNYRVGKYEVTAGQYTAFLNAVARTDTYGLYNPDMASELGCKITRSGSVGSYTYSIALEYENRPVNFVSWCDAARFANWLNNNQPTGAQDLSTTEDGAYYLNGAMTDAQILTVTRKTTWKWAITSEDEWYKAAYYKGGGTNAGYWDYPTQSDSIIYDKANYDFSVGDTTIVGTYSYPSAYGTYDQGGNVFEWNEAIFNEEQGSYRGFRGGSFLSQEEHLLATSRFGSGYSPTIEDADFGFRVSRLIAYTPVALVPDKLNVTRGSTVNVSVDMTLLSPITMAAISTNILYDPAVFIYDDESVVVQGGLLTHTWSLLGGTSPLGVLRDLRVGGIDLNGDPWYENLAAGAGRLFTFTLKIKNDAPLGPSLLTWGVFDGYDNTTAGFDYGDADFVDIILPQSALSGASINVLGEIPTAITLVSFEANPGSNKVTLTWETATEIDNAGFNILRAESENGPYVKINATIIPAKAGATQGATYQFIDSTAKNRTTYYYKLQDIGLNGSTTDHGPKSATPRLIFGFVK